MSDFLTRWSLDYDGSRCTYVVFECARKVAMLPTSASIFTVLYFASGFE
jgi:hypothetical protein